MWGPNTLLIPHISLHLPLPPPHSITLSYTSFHTSSHIPPSSPHTPTHFPTIPTHLPSPSQSVAKLPCDEVSVAKLLWRSYHVAKLLATGIQELVCYSTIITSALVTKPKLAYYGTLFTCKVCSLYRPICLWHNIPVPSWYSVVPVLGRVG